MFNAVELDKTTQNSRITFNCSLRILVALTYLLQLFHVSQNFHVYVSVFSLMLGQEVFEILMYCMQERIDFFQGGLSQIFNRGNSLINHVCKFLTLVLGFFRLQIQFVKQDFTDLYQLLMSHLEVFI
jgi:hypothetical protein